LEQYCGTGTGILDSNSALENGVESAKDQGPSTKEGERKYSPFSTREDTQGLVEPSNKGIQEDRKRAALLEKSLRKQTTYLRDTLYREFRALEETSVLHGTPQGLGLSPQRLAQTYTAISNGRTPDQAYYRKSSHLDTSIASVIVADESSSMMDDLRELSQMFIAITQTLSEIGGKVQALGIRDGQGHFGGVVSDTTGYTHGDYHRTQRVHYDIFKDFDEDYNNVRWRFANTRATGGTPLADGVHMAIQNLSDRKEAHRFCFILTDGRPNKGHGPVIKYLIRCAKEAGIHVIGVGIGPGARYVPQWFENHVFDMNSSRIPKKLVAKILDLVKLQIGGRGQRVRMT
jgi:nitric oxide reductase activation protein